MLTMGIGASYLTSAFRNPAWARTYAMQFAGPVPVSEQRPTLVTYTAEVRAAAATVALTAQLDGGPTFARASAIVDSPK